MTLTNKNRAAWTGVLLTALAMIAGAAVWAAGEHKDIRGWTAEQDYVTKTELKLVIKEQYVSQKDYKEDFTRLDERQQAIREDVSEIKDLISDVHKALYGSKRINFNRPRYVKHR